MRTTSITRPLPAVLLAAAGVVMLSGCAGPASDDAPAALAPAAADGAEPWVPDDRREALGRTLEAGTGAHLTVLDVYSPAEYEAALRRQLDTAFGEEQALPGGGRQASGACVAANREVTELEAGSGARAVAGAGNANGAESASTHGYVNLTVTDFPSEEAARRSWEGHLEVRGACADQQGWLGVLDARTLTWAGGEAVAYGRSVPGAAVGQEVRMRAVHVLDGRRQYVLNRRADETAAGVSPEEAAEDLAVLRRVSELLPPQP